MISLQLYDLDDDGNELCQVLEDECLRNSIYIKIFPELHEEITAQYETANNHFYHLSDKAHRQYMEFKYGFVTMA